MANTNANEITGISHTLRDGETKNINIQQLDKDLRYDFDSTSTKLDLMAKSLNPEFLPPSEDTFFGVNENDIIECFIKDGKVFNSETSSEEKFLDALFFTKEMCEAYIAAPFM